jgi:hypothetical protein
MRRSGSESDDVALADKLSIFQPIQMLFLMQHTKNPPLPNRILRATAEKLSHRKAISRT